MKQEDIEEVRIKYDELVDDNITKSKFCTVVYFVAGYILGWRLAGIDGVLAWTVAAFMFRRLLLDHLFESIVERGNKIMELDNDSD